MLYGVGGGRGELGTVGFVVTGRHVKDRRRLLGELCTRKFSLARTALSHSLGRLGITGATTDSNSCVCVLPDDPLCGHVVGKGRIHRRRIEDKFISVDFSTGVTIVGAHPNCTKNVTCSVSRRSLPPILTAITNSSAVLLIVGRGCARRTIGRRLRAVVPRVGVVWPCPPGGLCSWSEGCQEYEFCKEQTCAPSTRPSQHTFNFCGE